MADDRITVEFTTDEARALLVLATHSQKQLSASMAHLPDELKGESESMAKQLRLVEAGLRKMFDALRVAEM
jgi:hypothetical protein